jgi:formate dehydrogenase alpha subunit
MTNSIEDILESKCILAVGTNTTSAHPIIGLRVRKAVRGGAKLIVANPREIELCRMADLFIRHRPGTDVAMLCGMAKVIVDEGLWDREFVGERCENFDAFRESLAAFDPATVENITGVPKEEIAKAARLYASTRPAALLYSMGITQHSHGTDNVLACGNLAMLTGNIGRPGAGVNPLRGQNNVQGSCDMGGLPDVFPGYQKVESPAARRKFEAAWGTQLPPKPGLTLTEIFAGATRGDIKAIYLVGENPVISDPDAHHVEEAIKKLEFFVVQDLFLTETAEMADVVLPAASFAEKDGTYTNTERRVQRVRRAIEPLGRPDWLIICELAKRMGATGFDFQHPSQIMDEAASLTPSYGGISYSRLEGAGLQWPCPSADHPGTPILHTARFNTPNGKGRFVPLKFIPPAELPDDEYPLILTTGRSLYQFHTGTMTRKVAGLNALHGRELLEINPEDAGRLGIADGDSVRVSSRRGMVSASARLTANSPRGVVFMTFHFVETRTNLLTSPFVDPVAKTPEAKVCAVRVEKA